MLMYRKDMLSATGSPLSDHPTWDQVAAAAKAVHTSSVSGICLRGLPGWGEQLAPLDTVVNTYGGRWFDEKWNAQLTQPEFKAAVSFYINLIKTAGEPGAGNAGFTECLNAYNSGKVAMWYDATVAASNFTGAAAANSGYAFAPHVVKDWSGWLWAWALGMPSSSKKKDAAWTFADWATNKEYIKLVGQRRAGDRRFRSRPGGMGAPAALAAGLHLCLSRHADPVRADDLLQLLFLEFAEARQLSFRRTRKLWGDFHQRKHPYRGLEHSAPDYLGDRDFGRPGARGRHDSQLRSLRQGPDADADDLALPHHADGRCSDLEGHAAQPAVRTASLSVDAVRAVLV